MTVRNLFACLAVAIVALTAAPALHAAGSEPPAGGESDVLTRARELIKEKDYKGAIPLLNMTVAEQPKNADAFNWLGYGLRKSGDFKAAEGAYMKALAIEPKHKGALEYLGELYVETKRPEKAREILARLQAACPGGCEELDDLKKALGAAN